MKHITNILIITLLVTVGGLTQAQENGSSASQSPPKPENGIRMNFKGASLDAVLEYLSKSAGFAIVKEADIEGTVDVWSHNSLTPDEAVDLLNTVLYQKGYTAIRNGRTLTVVTRDEAKQRNIPVRSGNQPEQIPPDDEMVTQIIPVRYSDAMSLIENLDPLLPSYATMSANESSNAVIITDTQANIRRMVEIIRALDTSISDISTLKVFPLQYSDAARVAEIVSTLFETEESDDRGGRRGPPMFGRGRGGDDDESDSDAKRAATRVVAVADENTNSVVVNAPEDLMPVIEGVIKDIDTTIEDITEINVFPLKHADATELAEQIQELFPDENEEQNAPRFGPPGMFRGRGGRGGNQEDQTQRQLQQTTVRCTADPRTNSVIITAARETMIQIAQMIQQLDKDPKRKQKVYVYHLEHADVDNVAEILRNIFESQSNLNINRTTDQNANTLGNRSVSEENFQLQGQGQ